MNARRLLVAYAAANALLYSLLLPLWEGFDEPFHFGYVQRLANGRGLPDPRSTTLSGEAGASILLAPASPVVKHNLPQVTSYSEYFALPLPARRKLRRGLYDIPSGLRWRPSQFVNYEAHHPPLAYLLLAFPERLLAPAPLPARVAILRIVIALTGSFLLLFGADRLFSQLGLSHVYRDAALFCLFSIQMIWATLAHIGNEWLAVPIAVWTLVTLDRYDLNPSRRSAVVSALIFSMGLLTKAYFLAFGPLFIGVFVVKRRWRDLALACALAGVLAGPWYARNVARYGSLTGMQEARAGAGPQAILGALPTLDWLSAISSSLRGSLWTGNNSFLTFSSNTLNLLIVVGLAALLCWAVSLRHTAAEWITLSYCLSFVLALGYDAIASYIFTLGAAVGPSRWYAEVLGAPLLGLALLGASRWRTPGKAVACSLVILFAYLAAATYLLKLIPLYGGQEGKATVGKIFTLYAHHLGPLATNLDTVTLAPAAVIFSLAGLVAALVVIQLVLLVRDIATHEERS